MNFWFSAELIPHHFVFLYRRHFFCVVSHSLRMYIKNAFLVLECVSPAFNWPYFFSHSSSFLSLSRPADAQLFYWIVTTMEIMKNCLSFVTTCALILYIQGQPIQAPFGFSFPFISRAFSHWWFFFRLFLAHFRGKNRLRSFHKAAETLGQSSL